MNSELLAHAAPLLYARHRRLPLGQSRPVDFATERTPIDPYGVASRVAHDARAITVPGISQLDLGRKLTEAIVETELGLIMVPVATRAEAAGLSPKLFVRLGPRGPGVELNYEEQVEVEDRIGHGIRALVEAFPPAHHFGADNRLVSSFVSIYDAPEYYEWQWRVALLWVQDNWVPIESLAQVAGEKGVGLTWEDVDAVIEGHPPHTFE